MKTESIIAQLDLEMSYGIADAERRDHLEQAARNYTAEFDAAYHQRLFQRELDRKQWLDVILPNIQKKAMLAKLAQKF